MKIYSIYKVTNKLNKKCYIGFDSNWPSRKSKHKERSLLGQQSLYKAIRKYGWENFDWEIIYQSLDGQHCLNVMEQKFISEYNSYHDGYNMTFGGDGSVGYKHTSEMKEYISRCKMGKSHPVSEETRQKIKEKLKGRKYTEEQLKNYGKNFIITSPNGEIHKIKNLNKFCRENNLICGHMVRVAKGVRQHHKNFRCKYDN